MDRVCTNRGLHDHNHEVDTPSKMKFVMHETEQSDPDFDEASSTHRDCTSVLSEWGEASDVPNFIPGDARTGGGVCYGSAPHRPFSTFDCDREIAGRHRLCYCEVPAPQCDVTDGHGPSSSYPCNCGGDTCGSGKWCVHAEWHGSAGVCIDAPGWRLSEFGESCSDTCDSRQSGGGGPWGVLSQMQVQDESLAFGLTCAATENVAMHGVLAQNGGMASVLPGNMHCKKTLDEWGEQPDVPNVACNGDECDCYTSRVGRTPSSFDCGVSIPGRSRLCYCSQTHKMESLLEREDTAEKRSDRDVSGWDTTVQVLITSGKTADLAKYFSPTASDTTWVCKGEASNENPFYSLRLEGVHDFAGQCPGFHATSALTDAQRIDAFECSLQNYGVGSFMTRVLPNKHWDILGNWKLQLEVGTLLRSRLDNQFLALLPQGYKDALPASFPDLSTMHTDKDSFFSSGSFVESWASRAAMTLRGQFLQCAHYHKDQKQAIEKDCLNLLSTEREDFCTGYARE